MQEGDTSEGFTPVPVPPFIEEFPADVGLEIPIHTGGPAPELFDDPMITEVPEAVGPDVLYSDGVGDFHTPGGNTVRNHGSRGTGEEYILGKGHTAEQIDDIIANPAFSYPAARGDTGAGGRDSATVLIGEDGNWVVVNDRTGDVIQVNDRFNDRQGLPE